MADVLTTTVSDKLAELVVAGNLAARQAKADEIQELIQAEESEDFPDLRLRNASPVYAEAVDAA